MWSPLVEREARKRLTPSSVAIGKRITPRAETRTTPGNYHYCFVDFSTAQEAERALNELNGKPVEGGNLRVSLPRSKGPAFEQGGTNHGWSRQSPSGRRPQEAAGAQEGQQEGQERPERREPTEKQRTIMTSNNWRSGAGSK
jgi:RNA recognition motif-containing protein